MKLMELFSRDPAVNDPRLDPEINYLDDLKFYMDNDNDIVSNVLFPAVKAHQNDANNPKAYTFYIKPIRKCIEGYVKEYELDDIKDDIFTKENIVELAKRIAQEQKQHIDRKEYDQ